NTQDEASIGWIEKTAAGQRGNGYRRNSIVGPTSRFQWSEGDPRSGNINNAGAHAWPCQKPPWGQLIAVNANTGDIAWKVRLGVTDELPEGKKNTGRMSMAGPIATAGGLVFIAATNDKRFRAFDSKAGKELWSTKLDMSAHAVPMTYPARQIIGVPPISTDSYGRRLSPPFFLALSTIAASRTGASGAPSFAAFLYS